MSSICLINQFETYIYIYISTYMWIDEKPLIINIIIFVFNGFDSHHFEFKV